MIKVTFSYEPDEHDPDDPSGLGLTEEEYIALMDNLVELGAADIDMKLGYSDAPKE